MITLEDCIAFSGLTEAEVMAIAEHEHVPEIAAAALAETLLKQRRGPEKIHTMIVEDIRAALQRGDRVHARELFAALRHFLASHPEQLKPGPETE
ncbi:MAG: hypothetical protein ACTSSR_03415 [Alphaproteobacteria bacterium]|jgi:hypothetical protein|nr:hypothetical protein [Hyphomicrobium sp.]